MKVPLADEVREARAQLDVFLQASRDLEEVMVALTELQGGAAPIGYEDWYARLAERWKLTLPSQPAKTSLLTARAALTAASGGMSRANARLQNLRQQQRELLSTPEHAELLAELDALARRSAELSQAVPPPTQRALLLASVADTLADAIATIAHERAQGADRPVRSSPRLQALYRSLPDITSALQLEPAEGKSPYEQLTLPGGPSGEDLLDWSEIDAYEPQYRELEAKTRELAQHWSARLAELEAEAELVNRRFHETFG